MKTPIGLLQTSRTIGVGSSSRVLSFETSALSENSVRQNCDTDWQLLIPRQSLTEATLSWCRNYEAKWRR